MRFFLALVAVMCLACVTRGTRPPDTAAATASDEGDSSSVAHLGPSVRLLENPDAADYPGDLYYLRRIQVRDGDRVDTVPEVLTMHPPVLAGGSRVLGFQYDEEEFIVAAFEYDLRQRRLQTLPLPTDFNAYHSAPSFSPDGSHLAYVIVPGDETAWGAVVSWPERQLVWRTERVQVPATDIRAASTRWISPDTVEILIAVGDYVGFGLYRVTGSVRERRVLLADTVAYPSRAPWKAPN